MPQTLNLAGAHGRIVDVTNFDFGLVIALILINSNDNLLAAVDAGLPKGGRLFDSHLRHA